MEIIRESWYLTCFRVVAFVVFVLVWMSCPAQRYLTDGLYRDSVVVFPVKTEQSDTVLDRDGRMKMASGVGVEFTGSVIKRQSKDYAVVRTESGLLIGIRPEHLAFCSDNESGAVNVIQNSGVALRHTDTGHFFYTLTPYILVFVLLSVAAALVYVVSQPWIQSGFLNLVLIIAAALTVLASVVIEVATFVYTNMEPIWWVDAGNVGFWVSLLRMLPLWVAVGLQLIATFGLYSTIDKFGLGESKSWVTLLVCVVGALVVDIVAIVVMAVADVSEPVRVTALAIITAVIVGLGVLGSLYFTLSKFKFLGAVLFTVIDLILVTGVVAIGFVFLLALIKLFLRSLVYIVVGVVIASVVLGGDKAPDRQSKTSGKKESYGDYLNRLDEKNKERERRWEIQKMYWRQCGILK